MADTYFDRIWDRHVVARAGNGEDLLYVDRHLIHDLHGALAFSSLKAAGRPVRQPDQNFGVVDHLVSTRAGRTGATVAGANDMIADLVALAREQGVRVFGLDDADQGIIHVVSAEQGIALPGLCVLATDSHACTAGALGALAWGIGTSESEHILATQTIRARKPALMRVVFSGALPTAIGAKDLVLRLIATIGVAGGRGYALEFDGEALRALAIEDRMTLCNMAMEAGSEIAVIRPDEATFAYVKGRSYAPDEATWDAALADWRALATGCDAAAARTFEIDVSDLTPQITWGTNPAQTIGVLDEIPSPDRAGSERERAQMLRALDYMGLVAGERLLGAAVHHVFIGSCTNARIDDLRRAADLVRGRRVASDVRAMVVPASRRIQRQAEREGLAQVFTEAGFEWREPGCSMCAGINGDLVGPGERCIATSNRNFEGRQGDRARTHLASPIVAAAAAIAGRIVDPREMMAR